MMSAVAHRGKYIFLVLATPIVADCMIAVTLALSGRLQRVHWYNSVLIPLAIGLLVASLWTGKRVNLPLTVIFCLCAGVALIIHGIPTNRVVPGDPFGHLAGWPPAMVILLGLWYLAAGLAFPLSPSVRAFFAHQRGETSPLKCNSNAEIDNGMNTE